MPKTLFFLAVCKSILTNFKLFFSNPIVSVGISDSLQCLKSAFMVKYKSRFQQCPGLRCTWWDYTLLKREKAGKHTLHRQQSHSVWDYCSLMEWGFWLQTLSLFCRF